MCRSPLGPSQGRHSVLWDVWTLSEGFFFLFPWPFLLILSHLTSKHHSSQNSQWPPTQWPSNPCIRTHACTHTLIQRGNMHGCSQHCVNSAHARASCTLSLIWQCCKHVWLPWVCVFACERTDRLHTHLRCVGWRVERATLWPLAGVTLISYPSKPLWSWT